MLDVFITGLAAAPSQGFNVLAVGGPCLCCSIIGTHKFHPSPPFSTLFENGLSYISMQQC